MFDFILKAFPSLNKKKEDVVVVVGRGDEEAMEVLEVKEEEGEVDEALNIDELVMTEDEDDERDEHVPLSCDKGASSRDLSSPEDMRAYFEAVLLNIMLERSEGGPREHEEDSDVTSDEDNAAPMTRSRARKLRMRASAPADNEGSEDDDDEQVVEKKRHKPASD